MSNLTPSQELIVLARKPLSEKTIALNVKKWKTGAINVDGCRVAYLNGEEPVTPQRIQSAIKAKREGKPWGKGKENRDNIATSGKWSNKGREKITQGDRQGRHPPNTLHDDSEEATARMEESSRFFMSPSRLINQPREDNSMTTKIISGCCLDHLPKMDSDSVDSIVTDPPYEIGIVGRNWDNAGVAYAPGVWIECLRVLKPGGHLVAFGGTRTYHRLAVAVEDVGFEIRDCLSWLYGSGFPKSMNVGKALAEKEWEGWGTNLKPSQELIVLARKPLAEKTIALNVKKWGTGAINVDGCRIPYQGEISPNIQRKKTPIGGNKSVMGMGIEKKASMVDVTDGDRQGRFPANTLHDGSEEVEAGFPTTGIHSNPLFDADGNPRAGALGDSEDGVMGFGRGQNPPDPQGRFPANTLHDGSEEVEEGFPTVSYEPVALKSIPIEGEYARSNSMSGKFPRTKRPHEKTIPASASRYFYCAKASRSEREAGLEAEKGQRANSHPTVKPLALMRWLCRLITPKGGKVLDPFAGSGTTGIAAYLEGFDFVGVEQDPTYAEIAEKRIRHWKGELE